MTNGRITVAVILLLVVAAAEWLAPNVPGPALIVVSFAFLGVAFFMRNKG